MTSTTTLSRDENGFATPLSRPVHTRNFGLVNWMGLWTLYKKEVRRFMKVGPQTLLAPMVSNVLYMTVFILAFAERRGGADGDFTRFLIPGLIMMGILNNSSANSSSSIMTGKVMGSIIDVLMPPLSSTELAVGYIGGAMTRGILVAIATALALSFFMVIVPQHIWAIAYFGLSAACAMSMVGILSGIWAEKFDQLAFVNQFIIVPLSFLSGTFYHITILPEYLQKISLANPLFYFIDGFRYGFLGTADGNIMTGIVYTASLNLVLFISCIIVLKSGWRLKA
ncbi:MAG TPA: multidrug ABC transporter permease [Hellea balneolensis]|uniref:Transport permease protein n=1 Tax=Hellea balneolensis TaxID=287478 RepID=A0A7C3FZS3_9PROT|nr:multidrug ABC transporter permease [Hellea balneolensis]